jgi:hypothetical protein
MMSVLISLLLTLRGMARSRAAFRLEMLASPELHLTARSRTRVHRVPAVVSACADHIAPASTPTLPIMSRLSASHAFQLHRRVLIDSEDLFQLGMDLRVAIAISVSLMSPVETACANAKIPSFKAFGASHGYVVAPV